VYADYSTAEYEYQSDITFAKVQGPESTGMAPTIRRTPSARTPASTISTTSTLYENVEEEEEGQQQQRQQGVPLEVLASEQVPPAHEVDAGAEYITWEDSEGLNVSIV